MIALGAAIGFEAIACKSDDDTPGRPASAYAGPDSEIVEDDGSSSPKRGSVSLSQSTPGTPAQFAYFRGDAEFVDEAVTARPGTVCTEGREGTCRFEACETDKSVAVPATPQARRLDAGPIGFEGERSSHTIAYGDEKLGYVDKQQKGSALVGVGETLRIVGLGSAEVPAFATTLVLRAPIQMLSPAPQGFDLTRLRVSTRSEFKLTWKGGTSDENVVVGVYGAEHTAKHERPRSVYVTCVFQANAGRGVVPASMMKLMPVGPDSFDSVSVASEQTRLLVAGDFRIRTAVEQGLGESYVTQYE